MIDDPVAVWLGSSAPGELDAVLKVVCALPQASRRTLVLWAPGELNPEAWRRVQQMLRPEDRLVLTGGSDFSGHGVVQVPVQIEPDPQRALVAAMLLMKEGESLVALAPNMHVTAILRSAICLGTRWRSGWDEAEGGEFHTNPRLADRFGRDH